MMKLKGVKEEELETMSYDDIAYLVLKENKSKMKLLDLFNEVALQLKLDPSTVEEHVGDFFSLISTEKRFIQLENGYWDLRENHTTKIELDNLDDEIEDDEELEDDIDEEDDNLNEEEDEMYIDENKDIDDDESDDDLKDLVMLDDEME